MGCGKSHFPLENITVVIESFLYSKALAETDRIVEQQMFQRYQDEQAAQTIAALQAELAKRQ